MTLNFSLFLQCLALFQVLCFVGGSRVRSRRTSLEVEEASSAARGVGYCPLTFDRG